MSLRIMHLANLNSANVGNGALILGTESVLSEDLGVYIDWRREPWDDYTFEVCRFDSKFVEKVNSTDGMVVCGAVTINGREYLKNSGWRLDLPLDLWKEIRKPVVFYGISYRCWENQKVFHIDKLRATLELILDSEKMLLAFRNDGTKEWVENTLGMSMSKASVIPDPGLYVPVGSVDIQRNQTNSSTLKLMLAFNDEDAEQRYVPLERRQFVVRGLAEAVKQIDDRWGVELVIVPHYFDDLRMISDFVNACPAKLAHRKFSASGLPQVDKTLEFYRQYFNADIILGMRVHAISPTIGMCLPIVPIITQHRISQFLEKAGLGDIGVDAFSESLVDDIVKAVENIVADRHAYSDRLSLSVATMRNQTREFNMKVKELFNV